jgi:hypothetical protein
MNTNVGLVVNQTTNTLPIIYDSWRNFTLNAHDILGNRGSFTYSVVAIVYSLSISAVVTWFLTIFVLTNYTIKPSWLLKSSTVLSSVYILLVVVKAITKLHNQQTNGYLSSPELLEYLNGANEINIFDLIVVFLLQINQVQVIMRIFLRQNDKRLTFFIGVAASVMSQAIWGVSKFHNFSPDDEAGDILPAFIYLVRIATSVCYAAIVSVFVLSKITYIIANKAIWLLSLLTVILIYSPVAFFVADVSNAFIYELSEFFSVVTYIVCVVIPWEWCNKFNLIMKAKEKEGILGRRFYEEELYELDRYEIFVEDNENEDNNDGDTEEEEPRNWNGGDHDVAAEGGPMIRRNGTRKVIPKYFDTSEESNSRKVIDALKTTKKTFLTITDGIIAAGFAIPRSVSVSTQNSEPRDRNVHLNDAHKLPINPTNNVRIELSNLDQNGAVQRTDGEDDDAMTSTQGRHRRNVFIYSRKEVVLGLSEDEDE